MISQKWATNVRITWYFTMYIIHVLSFLQAKLHSVDAITDPSGSTMDHLASTASSGDTQNYAEEVSNIQTLTAALQEVAQNATMGSVT